MLLTDAGRQARILARVGDLDPTTYAPTTSPDGLVVTLMPTLWAYWSENNGLTGRLRDLYVEVDAINAVLAALAIFVDTNTGQALQIKLNQRVANYQAKLTATTADLDKELKRVAASKIPGFITPILQTAPQMPPQFRPLVVDPNDPYYGGSPYFPLSQASLNGH